MNKKGTVLLGLTFINVPSSIVVATAFKLAFIALLGACVWHIPAWDQAKATHTEAIYQAQQMWPQQVFNKVPNTAITYKEGNGGNFAGGIDK